MTNMRRREDGWEEHKNAAWTGTELTILDRVFVIEAVCADGSLILQAKEPWKYRGKTGITPRGVEPGKFEINGELFLLAAITEDGELILETPEVFGGPDSITGWDSWQDKKGE